MILYISSIQFYNFATEQSEGVQSVDKNLIKFVQYLPSEAAAASH